VTLGLEIDHRCELTESKISFAQLIDRTQTEGIIDAETHDIVHTGRRNKQIHATALLLLNPAMAARVIGTSHKTVVDFGP
jgi:hypothetical protein